MVDVIVLPSQPQPIQLTAKAAVRKLGDHLEGFLANTHSRYPKQYEDPDYVLREDRVADILLTIACMESVDYKWAKRKAAFIRDLTGKDIKLGKAMEMIGRALGYKYWAQCVFARDANDQIENVWGSELLKHETMFEDRELTRVERREIFRNNRIQELISQNRHLHRK